MIKKILFLVLFFISFYSYSFAGSSIEIEGGDKEVYINSNVTLTGLVSGITCNTYTYDWFLGGVWKGVDNINFTFISEQDYNDIKFKLTCETGNPMFPYIYYFSKPINVTLKSPEVYAGSNTSYNSGDIVSLSGSIIGTPCSVFDYQWEQTSGPTVEITNSGSNEINSNFYDSASFIFPDTTENIVLKLNITPKSCFHAGNTYSGTVTYSKTISSGGGKSRSKKMREEAEKLFFDSGSIDKIDLELKLYKQEYSPIINFNWNNIGGDGHIYYNLEYSTGSKFEKFKSYDTTFKDYNFIEYNLDQESFIHFFRINACYNGKCSKYSNIIKYYSEDYLPLSCNKNKKYIYFDDIFLDSEFIINYFLKIKCRECKK